MIRLYYEDGRVARVVFPSDYADVDCHYPPRCANHYPEESVYTGFTFRRTTDQYNGEFVYREVT